MNYKKILQQTLEKQYDAGEVNTMIKYYFLDRFNHSNTSQIILNSDQKKTFINDLKRFEASEPYQYIVEIAYFFNRPYHVNSHVLIPRPETEELVLKCLKAIKDKQSDSINILEVGTGTGCISISLLMESKVKLNVKAIDVSTDAINVAKINADNYGQCFDLIQLDFLDESEWQSLGDFDIIVSNPPYISLEEMTEMHDNVQKFEPHLALFSEDPLLFYKKIANFSQQCSKLSMILCEINPLFVAETKSLFERSGFTSVELFEDLQGKYRILQAHR